MFDIIFAGNTIESGGRADSASGQWHFNGCERTFQKCVFSVVDVFFGGGQSFDVVSQKGEREEHRQKL